MDQLKLALRQVIQRPALSLVVIAMLAVGVGSTTAIYSLIYETILRTVPVQDSDELVSLRSPGFKPGPSRGDIAVGGDPNRLFSYPSFQELQTRQRTLTGLAAHYGFLANLELSEDTTRLMNAVLVSGNYFGVLGVRPALGRLIDAQDAPYVGEARVAVLSYTFWQTRYAGDPNVVGEPIVVNNQELTVVGVAPPEFAGTMRGWTPSVYVPLTLRWLMQPEEPRNDENRQAYWLTLFGRLAPGVTLERAQAELDGIYRGLLRAEAPDLVDVTEADRARYLEGSIALDPGERGQIYRQVRVSDPFTLALGATLFVLLIACVNIANLLLARGASRAGEMAIRASVGASRTQLVVQLLAESTVLGVVGGLLSIPVAFGTLRIIAALPASGIAQGGLAGQLGVVLSAPVLLFAAALTVATVVVFGLVPALSTGRADAGAVLKAQAAQSPGGRGLARFRGGLVTAQIALSLVLLVLAGLFTRSLVNVTRIDYGMDVDSIVGFSVTPLLGGYSGERLDALYDRVREELAAQPGVEAVASTAFPLLYGFQLFTGVTVAGVDEQVENAFAQANPMTSPGFFAATAIPLVAGRDFTTQDSTPSPSVAIVNESFVRRFDLAAGAVGTTLRLQGNYVPEGTVEIIGVVEDAKYAGIKADIQPQIFTPRPPRDTQFVALFYYVRAAIDADSLARMIPDVIGRIDGNVPVSNLQPLRRLVDANTATDRLMSLLSAAFAGLATLLAAIGLYALLAFNMAQRRRELGLRLALGAEPKRLLALVLGEIAWLAAIGTTIGLVLALALGRVAQSLLFGLSAYDPLVLAIAVVALAAVVLLASWLPALRASRVTPMEALRYE